MKITVLIENTAGENCSLTAEHGLSFFIEYGGKRILLDAGSTEACLENARKMGLDISRADLCLLSHGHYDHSGGFARYMRENPEVRLAAMDCAAGGYYSDALAPFHYIGIPEDLKALLPGRQIAVTAPAELMPGVWAVPHSTPGLGRIGEMKHLYRSAGDGYAGDDFSHECSYVFLTEKGLVIFNSCSHGGVMNILREVHAVFPGKPLCAFLGGLHMLGKKDGKEFCTFSPEELDTLAEGIRASGLQRIYTGHCTGAEGLRLLQQRLGSMLLPLHTGSVIEL